MDNNNYTGTGDKVFYHPGKEPRVVLYFEDSVLEGVVQERGYGFIRILIAKGSDTDIANRKIVTKVCIGDSSNTSFVSSCGISHAREEGSRGQISVKVTVPDETSARKLETIFHLLTETISSLPGQSVNVKRIPNGSSDPYSNKSIEERQSWLEKISEKEYVHIKNNVFDPVQLPGNIENYIGAVQVPVGIAGPLLIKGSYVNGYVPLPVATTEGALVSSITRGAVVCSLAGGIKTFVTGQIMVRAPVFFCEDMAGAIELERWIERNKTRIIEQAETVSSVAKVSTIETELFSNSLHVKFYYSTGDAAGQNMTTACTYFACEWIENSIKTKRSIRFKQYMIEGNFSGDKKLNFQNFIKGRGVSVQAECHIPDRVLKRFLRITSEKFIKLWNAAEVAAMQIGMFGSNINFANVIAGVFTATGQDIASVHESSGGIVRFEKEENGLKVSVLLPSLVIGTVGGGTALPTQRECLEMMGCYGQGKVFRLAEIIAAASLALDLSTGAAIGSNEFVRSHEKLGRNRPDSKLRSYPLNKSFFNRFFDGDSNEVVSVQCLEIENKNGITSEFSNRKKRERESISLYELDLKNDGEISRVSVVLKEKSSEAEIIDVGIGLAKLSGEDRLPGLFENYSAIFGFDNCNKREIGVFKYIESEIRQFLPKSYGTYVDEESDRHTFLMEDLSGMKLLNTVDSCHQWKDTDIKTVLSDLAHIHSVYFEKYEDIPELCCIEKFDAEALISAGELLKELISYNSQRFGEIISGDLKDIYEDYFINIREYSQKMLGAPMTLCHNDFNLRNICLRTVSGKNRLVVYDWELARYQNPQIDLLEFLVFVFDEKSFLSQYGEYMEFYRDCLEKKTGKELHRDTFLEIMHANALYLGTTRFNLYLLAHNLSRFSFMERVYSNVSSFILVSS